MTLVLSYSLPSVYGHRGDIKIEDNVCLGRTINHYNSRLSRPQQLLMFGCNSFTVATVFVNDMDPCAP